MPANVYNAATNPNGFQEIIVDIPANSAAAVDLTHLIDVASNPNNNRLENKPLTGSGINNFGLHITSTNVINAYWEVNYEYAADLWTLKGSNGLGTLFYTPFQTFYDTRQTFTPKPYSAIDIVATKDNTLVTIQLPPGKRASYGFNASNNISVGGSYTLTLNRGQTFSVFPYQFSGLAVDRLAGTRIQASDSIAVVVKDDALLTPGGGQDLIGDQIVPVDIIGNNYIVPDIGNANHVYVLATEDNTQIHLTDADGLNIGIDPYATLNEGQQAMVVIPTGSKYVHITSTSGDLDPVKPFYVFQVAPIGNSNRGGALVPAIGCTGNTQLAFTRARDKENAFNFFIITEKGNEDKFLVDGEKQDDVIDPDGFTEIEGTDGWVAYFKSGVLPISKLSVGQHLVENTGGIFHLAIYNGFQSAQNGGLYYGYYSDFGGLNIGASVAGTNSEEIHACYGEPIQLYAFGGTTYRWTPDTYLDDATSNIPTAINLPPGPHSYTVEVSGACGSGTIPLTIIVAQPVDAHFETNVTSGCSPLEIIIEDQSSGMISWQYDLGDNLPLIRYDLDHSQETGGVLPDPPDPFIFAHSYINDTDQPIDYEITLMVKNASGCADILTKTITVFPEIESAFTADPTDGCEPLEVGYTNLSTGDTAIWLWEFGDGGSSVERDPVHEFRNLFGPGNLIFDTRLIAISPYNCRDTSTLPITVRPYIEASFAYDTVAECSPHEIIITDQSIGAELYFWDFGDETPVSNDTGPVIRHTYVNDTQFPVTDTITLRVENLEGCFHEIQRAVTIYPGVVADFVPVPAEACSPAEILFQDNSTGPIVSHFWDFGDGGTSTDQFPIHRYDRNMLRHDTVFRVTLVVTSNELCRDTATYDVVIHPYIEAAFTIEDVVGCHPFTVEINNESINADSYQWDFGDGIGFTNDSSSTLSYTYLNGTDSTVVYPLRLVVFNEEGCSDTIVRYITVHPEITPQFNVSDLDGCHPLRVTFTDQSVNAINYLWDFGDGAASVEHSPVHTFNNFGTADTTYWVNLTVSTSDGECVKSVSVPITVYPQVVAEFTFPNALGCGPFDIEFENLSIGGSTFTWNFGDGNPDLVTTDPGAQVHTFVNSNYVNPQEFLVSLTAENSFGCSSEAIKTVTVYPAVESNFTASSDKGCHPLTVDFTNLSMGGQTFVWDFGDGSTSNQALPSHTFTNTGTIDSIYTVKLRSIAPNNVCSDSFFMDITVHPYVLANFTIPDQLGCTPLDVVLQNSSINASRYYWDFGDGNDTVTFDKLPLVHRYFNTDFTNQQEFEISLVAENFAGCSHEIRRSITVEPDIIADFDADQTEGCHPLTVDFTNFSNGAAYYHWDFGNGTTSQETDPIQTFTNIGSADVTYRVWLRASASNHECKDSTYVDIVVHPYIMADFTFLEQVNCTPSFVQFHNASTPGATYHWDFGDGSDTTTMTVGSLYHTFNNTDFANKGIFQVTLTATAGSCVDQAVRNVEVYPAIEALFEMSVEEGCHPLQVGFDNLSRGGYTYIWDFGDGATSESDSPTHTFTNYTDAPVTRLVHLRATSRTNCTSEITAPVTIHPKPKARFETPRIIDCAPFNVAIVNTSINADQYLWDLGGDTTFNASSQEPFSHAFENLTDDIATYELRLTATSDYGCTDSVQQKIYVYPRTIADFTVNDGDCSPFMAHFTNQSVRGQTYLWDFGDGSLLSTTDPSNLYFNLSGNDTSYLVTLTTTSQYGCVDTATDIIDVYAQPDVEFIATPTFQMYPASTVDFTNMTNPGSWDFRWDMGDSFTTLLENPQAHSYGTWGEYTIWLSASTEHCSDSVAHTIRIVPAAPIAEFDTIIPGCEPHTVQFRNNSIYGEAYLWEFGDGTTSTEFEPEHTFEEYGIYNVKLTVTGQGGTEYAYRQVEVYRMPVVDFRVSPELVMLPDDEIKLFNLTKYGDSYMWDFGDGQTSSDENPRHLYNRIGQYDITLEVWTDEGCADLLVKPALITVEAGGYIYFPNAFKPDLDGGNGGYYSLSEPEMNNIFHPYWEGVVEYNLEIYTRWGEKLFYSNDVNIGWDGYNNGTLSAQGVYVFRSWGFFINGEYFEVKGDVTLLYHNK
jgi:PKD repeat protein